MKKFFTLIIALSLLGIFAGCPFAKPNPEENINEEELGEESSKNTSGEETTSSEEEKSEKSAEKELEDTTKTDAETKTSVETGLKTEAKTSEAETQENMKTSKMLKSEVKIFNLVAKQFDFTPSTITVNEGDIIRINITTKDVTHGFVIPDFGVNKVINPGATVTAEFVANKKGTFEFRCSVFCGEGHTEMKGTLIVK